MTLQNVTGPLQKAAQTTLKHAQACVNWCGRQISLGAGKVAPVLQKVNQAIGNLFTKVGKHAPFFNTELGRAVTWGGAVLIVGGILAAAIATIIAISKPAKQNP